MEEEERQKKLQKQTDEKIMTQVSFKNKVYLINSVINVTFIIYNVKVPNEMDLIAIASLRSILYHL